MSALLSFCLYFTSYAPLWLSIAFLDVLSIINNNQNITTEIISLIVIVLSSLLIISGPTTPTGTCIVPI